MYNEKFPEQSQKFCNTGPIQKSFVLFDRKYYYPNVQKKFATHVKKKEKKKKIGAGGGGGLGVRNN